MTQQKAFLERPHDLDGYRYALAHKKVNESMHVLAYMPWRLKKCYKYHFLNI